MAMTEDSSPWSAFSGARSMDEWMQEHKTVVAATTASLVSTFAGFPLDSLKSRLQSAGGEGHSIPRLAAEVIREEGVRGLWRGSPLPLVSIAVVRTISFTIYTNTKFFINGPPPSASHAVLHDQGDGALDFRDVATSDRTDGQHQQPHSHHHHKQPFSLNILNSPSMIDVFVTSALAGAASGAVVSVGSCPFELVKVRRQLEFQIARERGLVPKPPSASSGSTSLVGNGGGGSPMEGVMSEEVRKGLAEGEARRAMEKATGKEFKCEPYKPPGTWEAVKQIHRERGFKGLWTGFKLHAVRDTLGTSLYFAEYDIFRYLLGRTQSTGLAGGRGGFGSEVQGPLPHWAKGWIPVEAVPFLCGSLAGVTSWAAIYPLDAIKTKTQQRMLSGLKARSPLRQLSRLVRGVDPNNPKPLIQGIHRLYRGLGISMVRSMLTHGLLWTMVDSMSRWIDSNPTQNLVSKYIE